MVGSGVVPPPQAVKSRAAVSKLIKACRVDLLENIVVTSISEWLNVWIGLHYS
jgi:hypothetical protein